MAEDVLRLFASAIMNAAESPQASRQRRADNRAALDCLKLAQVEMRAANDYANWPH